MNNLILQLLPILLLIILYVFIFTRRGEVQRAGVSFKGYDWLTFVSVILAGNVLASAMSALDIKGPVWLPIAITLSLLLILFIVAMRRARAGKPILQRLGDERMGLIYARAPEMHFSPPT